MKERLWQKRTAKGLRGCQGEIGLRGDSTGDTGDTRMLWEARRRTIASVCQIIVADGTELNELAAAIIS